MPRLATLAAIAFSFVFLWAAVDTADAQVSTNAFVRNYLLSRPTVSPYLNLLRVDGFGLTANYQTLVRPQIEQRELAVLQEQENFRLQQQLNAQQTSIESLRRQRSQRVFSTGHQSRFMDLRGYFPGFSAVQQRR